MKDDIAPEKLQALLDYNPQTGILVWKERTRDPLVSLREHNRWNSRWAGQQAGCITHFGYVAVKFGKAAYKAHRIAWAMHYGAYPSKDEFVDHINRDKADNRLSNLRLASRSENGINRPEPVNNTSGHKGVMAYPWSKKRPWVARIGVDGTRRHIGYFSTFDEACSAYEKAARNLYGTFAEDKTPEILA